MKCNSPVACTLQQGQDAEHQQEALDHLLDIWVPLLQEAGAFPEEPLRAAVVRLFELYLRSRLSPPEGTRPPVSALFKRGVPLK